MLKIQGFDGFVRYTRGLNCDIEISKLCVKILHEHPFDSNIGSFDILMKCFKIFVFA